MIVLKIKTKEGDIVDLPVEELLEVDGKQYRSSEDNEFLTAQVARLAGRIDTIEVAIFGRQHSEGEPQ